MTKHEVMVETTWVKLTKLVLHEPHIVVTSENQLKLQEVNA